MRTEKHTLALGPLLLLLACRSLFHLLASYWADISSVLRRAAAYHFDCLCGC
jgi:hypothetical protein